MLPVTEKSIHAYKLHTSASVCMSLMHTQRVRYGKQDACRTALDESPESHPAARASVFSSAIAASTTCGLLRLFWLEYCLRRRSCLLLATTWETEGAEEGCASTLACELFFWEARFNTCVLEGGGYRPSIGCCGGCVCQR